jgi:linoleoyl-CoA desaturase
MEKIQRAKFVNKEGTDFFKTLRARVDAYFEENKISKHANYKMVLKSISVFFVYLAPLICVYCFSLSVPMLILAYSIMGVGMAGVGMSVMHDANHGAYSAHKWVNSLLGWSLNFIGGFSVNWKMQHNILHHTFTNVAYVDEDVKQRIKMRWTPHYPAYRITRYQYIYAFFAYTLSTLLWTLTKDFRQYFGYINSGALRMKGNEMMLDVFNLVASKIFYFTYILIIPIFVFDYAWQWALLGYFLLHVVGGLILTTVFQLAHVVEGPEFPLPNENGIIENEWAIHQMQTTADFGHNNAFLRWYAGGLTHQIEHHLFPQICHIHYPKIEKIVKDTAAEYQVPYHYFDGYFSALKSHIRLLKEFGIEKDFDLARA